MDYCDCKAGLRAATPETGAGNQPPSGVVGANVAAFTRVADAMLALGMV